MYSKVVVALTKDSGQNKVFTLKQNSYMLSRISWYSDELKKALANTANG